MSDKKAKAPDSLTKTANIALSESDLDKVSGGNKAKTADKAYTQMDGYIKQ
jgi:hypothetical protein